MKKLFSLVIVIMHVTAAIAAIAAPKTTPAPPAPPAAPPAPSAPATAEDIRNVNGNSDVEAGKTVRSVTAVNGNVTVYGHVTQNATSINGSIYVRNGGRIDGDATSVNGKVVKDAGATIGGKISSTNGGDTNINIGHRGVGLHKIGNTIIVERGQTVVEATAIQGDVVVRGHVTGDATAVLGNVYVKPGGKVDGDATAVGGKVIRTGDGNIAGDVTSLDLGIPGLRWWGLPEGWWTTAHGLGGWWMYAIYVGTVVLFAAIIAAIVIALFPQRMLTIAECSFGKPGLSLLYGIGGVLLVIPTAVLLLITCIGIPLIAVEAVLILFAIVAGIVGVKLALGRKLGLGAAQTTGSLVLAGVVGSTIVTLLHVVPLVGGIIAWTLIILGAGAVMMTGFGARPDWFASRFDKTSRSTAPEAVPAAQAAYAQPQTPYYPPQAPPVEPPTPPSPPAPPAGPTEEQ